jgi:hypothetical protein
MNSQDFTTTILVDQTPRQAYDAINNVRGWWSQNIEGDTDKLNSIYDYHYQDVHRSKIKVVELVTAQKVVWLVLENYFKFTEDKSEWVNTKIIFDITRKDNKTEVRFTHQGLVPDYECYNVCFDSWTGYIQNSLKKLIATGKGEPTPKGKAKFNEELIEKYNLQ